MTNEQGLYVATQIVPAAYTIKVSTTGFAPSEITNVNVQVGQERQVNVTLQAATVSTEVTVEGGSLSQVDTSSARIGVNVTEREVAELPLNGRQISQLYLLTPGAVNNGAGTFDDVRFNGRANQQNIIRFDGVEGTSIIDASPGNINGEVSSSFRLQASLESVQEFRVESSNYPAEYGTGTGGQISVITKSGGNTVHGDLFEYLRNDAFDARNFFDTSKNKLRLNQFGGSVGGPIKRDKTFFFGSYESVKQRINFPIVETTLSAAARARAVPAIQPLLAAFPVGQGPTQNPDFDVVNVAGRSNLDEYAGTVRFDHNFNDRYRLYARYQRDQGYYFADQNSTLSAYTVTAVPQNAVVNLNQVLSPTVINETKVGLNAVKTRINGIPNIPLLNGVALQLSGSVALAGIAGQGGTAGIATPTGLVRANSATNGRGQPYTNDTISFIDNLSLIKGNHNLKFGIEIRPIELYTDRQGGTTYTFNNVSDFLANKPASIQYLGDVSAASPFTGKAGMLHLRNTFYIGYAQDEWKVNPQLTINYGLRYEYFGILHEVNNKAVWFNIRTGQLEPGSRDWYQASKLNFAPRLGITYAPARFAGKTVFRLGAGYYYGAGQTEDQLQPAESDRISTTISSAGDPRLAYPLDIPALVSSYNPNSPTVAFQPRAYSPDYTVPEKILQYTASIQQQLPGSTVLTVAYVGSQGRNLFLRSIANRIIGVTQNTTTGAGSAVREFGNQYAEIDYKTSHGSDHYDSLQTTLNRRFAHGLTLGSQWTYAHSIGNTSGSNEARTSANNFSFAGERGNSNFDVRHSFNLTTLYEVPYGKGRQYGSDATGLAQALIGGWQVGGIVNAHTGLPIDVLITRPDIVYVDRRTGTVYGSNPVSAYDPNIVPVVNVPGGGASRNIRRPDVIAGVNPYLDVNRQFLNPAAFADPAPGTYGNLGRNALHGPNLEQLDLTFDKRFAFSERTNLEFRAEVYNILNHTNFAVPGGGTPRFADPLPTSASQVGAANKLQPGQPFSTATQGGTFGQLTSTVSNSIGLGTNRQIQLSLRLNF